MRVIFLWADWKQSVSKPHIQKKVIDRLVFGHSLAKNTRLLCASTTL